MRRLAPFLLVAVLAGCGGSSTKSNDDPAPSAAPAELSPQTALVVAKANFAISTYCLAVIRSGATNAQDIAKIHAVNRLIEIARRNPDAIVPPVRGRPTMRQVLSDEASVLDNGNCDPGAVRQLERAIATLG